MRPTLLNPLFTPVSSLSGIGPKLSIALTRLLRSTDDTEQAVVGDLLFHLPSSLIDRRNRPQIAEAEEGVMATIKLRIDRHQPPPRGNKRVPYKIHAHEALT